MTSTFVETVSIDCEDFNESFLTCGTCLYMYDGGEHTPKLLQCSHTVCIQCLDRIVATFARDTGQFRCPICRELITIPRGGVAALPPSFLVNQLLDLMARQKKEVVPKCSLHQTEELLFCETCYAVFCPKCTGGSHTPGPGLFSFGNVISTNSSNVSQIESTADHTVIPLAITIKRLSEIYFKKANEYTSKLKEAQSIVSEEVHRLDHNVDSVMKQINATFQTILNCVEKARQDLMDEVARTCDDKKRVLDNQISIIQEEKMKIEKEIQTTQHQIDTREITKKIYDLNNDLDRVNALCEPRENCYVEYVSLTGLESQLLNVLKTRTISGELKTSKTWPFLCRASMDTSIANLETVARITTIDYNGEEQSRGGDPVVAEVVDSEGRHLSVQVTDKGNGVYEAKFTPPKDGTYCLKVFVFDRPIRNCPLFFDVTSHNSPLIVFGSRGTKDKEFLQPCGVAVDSSDNLFVIDTGNLRLKKLTSNLNFMGHVYNEGLEGRSVTGICIPRGQDNIFFVNWRTKTITEVSQDGQTISTITHEDLKEPVDIAIDGEGNILVADNGIGSILVLEPSGKLMRNIGSPGTDRGHFKDLSSVTVALNGDIVVADSRIQVFSPDGIFLREVNPQGRGKGRYGGVICDENGFMLATRTEKAKSFIQVFDYSTGSLYSTIDSHGHKMKWPTGLATMRDGHVVVVDIGNDTVKKFRYI